MDELIPDDAGHLFQKPDCVLAEVVDFLMQNFLRHPPFGQVIVEKTEKVVFDYGCKASLAIVDEFERVELDEVVLGLFF